MYCPYCGQSMNLTEGGWYCASGDMYFSSLLAKTLLSIINDTPVNPKAVIPWEGTKPSAFHCPRCQQQMVSDERGIKQHCPHCGLDLPAALVFQLVELHPRTPLR